MSLFFRTNQEQKDYIGQKISKTYPQFKTGGMFFREYLKNYLNKDSIILDAGCGCGGIISEFKSVIAIIIGVDINEKLLAENQIVDQKITASLEQIPLADNSVEVVSSEFVLEHLKNPGAVLGEVSRVLKPGGVFIFITSNIINPIITSSKFLPLTFHSFLRNNLLKKEEEAHQTYYRANSRRRLINLGLTAGFNDCEILRAGNPEYLGFCKPLVPMAIFFEKFIDNKYLNIFKTYLIGCFKKN